MLSFARKTMRRGLIAATAIATTACVTGAQQLEPSQDTLGSSHSLPIATRGPAFPKSAPPQQHHHPSLSKRVRTERAAPHHAQRELPAMAHQRENNTGQPLR